MAVRGGLAGLVVASLAVGCTPTPPDHAVVFIIDSDFEVPGELNAVSASITEPDGSSGGGFGFLLNARPATASPEAVGGCMGNFLPMSQLLVRDPGVPITVDFVAERVETGGEDRTVVGRHQVVIELIADRWLRLPVRLDRDCGSVVCEAGETCDQGMCRPAAVDPRTLADFDRTRENEVFCEG